MYNIIYDYSDGESKAYAVTLTSLDEERAKAIFKRLNMSDYCLNIEMFQNTLENERGLK